MFKKVSTSMALLLFVFSISTQGCSTIIHGSHQDLPINTTPPGYKARIDTQSCVTPCSLRISRLAENLYITTKGDTEKMYPLSKSVNIWEVYVGNIIYLIPGVLIGVVVDEKSGAKWSIEPVNIILPTDTDKY